VTPREREKRGGKAVGWGRNPPLLLIAEGLVEKRRTKTSTTAIDKQSRKNNKKCTTSSGRGGYMHYVDKRDVQMAAALHVSGENELGMGGEGRGWRMKRKS